MNGLDQAWSSLRKTRLEQHWVYRLTLHILLARYCPGKPELKTVVLKRGYLCLVVWIVRAFALSPTSNQTWKQKCVYCPVGSKLCFMKMSEFKQFFGITVAWSGPSGLQVLMDLHGGFKNGPSGSVWKQKRLYCPVGSMCALWLSEWAIFWEVGRLMLATFLNHPQIGFWMYSSQVLGGWSLVYTVRRWWSSLV